MEKDFSHLKDIKLEQLNDTNISILIGADELKLHLYTESRIGNKKSQLLCSLHLVGCSWEESLAIVKFQQTFSRGNQKC